METLETVVTAIRVFVWEAGIPVGDSTISVVVIVLIGTGMFLTLRLGFIQLRHFGHGVAVATGRYDDPESTGDVSHFQALSTALSATVGIGNIAGVALAIHWGGPGALVWMWLTAILGMATKYAEVTLSMHYRSVHQDADKIVGTVSGGPMYYIEHGLGPNWKWMAIFFAVMLGFTAFLTGNAIQANTIADTAQTAFGLNPWITGVVLVVIVASVILGGITRIGRITSILAPLMAAVYVLAALLIVLMNLGDILPAFATIFSEAFNPTAGVAGTGVGAILVTMTYGVNRGLFSNEAGQGSAPIAHAAAKTEEPVSEAVVALLGPFIDTIVICTMTALVIVMTGVYSERVPTEITLAGGDLTWVSGDAGVGYEEVTAPAEIQVQNGIQTAGSAAFVAWHEVVVEQLFTDEDMTQPFTGSVFPTRGEAVDGGGTVHTSLWGMAVESGAPLTMYAFRRGLAPLGDWGHIIVIFSVFLFGISTAIAWSYYGDRCAIYLFGERAVLPYKMVYLLMHFLGAGVAQAAGISLVWEMGDIALGIVILPNLIALVLLSGTIKRLTNDYFERKPWKTSGKV
ncbi:MAG: sodium:alanine symporter family protein [Gemmatimonadetes bacterium]|nr:sodium:alanine symporter family protein [Gemmatimonadota bacterium]